mgnify:FL=1
MPVDHDWVGRVPTEVLREMAEWWTEELVVVTASEDPTHEATCDGTTHGDDWTRAVCVELRRREREETR